MSENLKAKEYRIKTLPLLPLAAIALFIFYLAWVAARPQEVFWSLDEGGKFIHLQSILRTGNIATPLVYPGKELDPDYNFVPLFYSIRRNNQLYSWWPVGLPLATLPFFRIFGWLGLYILPAAAGAASAYLAGEITRRLTFSPRLGLAACLLTGLTTPITFYATMFWEHTLSTAFCLATLLTLLRAYDRKNLPESFLAGLLASTSIFFRLDTAPILVGFGLVMLVKRWKQALFFALGTILAVLPWLWLNLWTSGHSLGPTYLQVSTARQPFETLLQVGIKFLSYALFNPPRTDTYILSNRILFAASLLLLLGTLAALLRRTRFLSVIFFAGLVALCAWVLLQPSQYQAVHGFVLVAPQIVFGFYLFFSTDTWKKSLFPAFLLSALTCYAIVYLELSWVSAGGLQWGPRYLLAIYPLLIIAGIIGISSINRISNPNLRRLSIAVFTIACLVGLGFQTRGILTARSLMVYYSRSIPAFTDHSDAPIILTWEGFAMDVPTLYWQGNVLSLSSNKPDWDQWNNHAKTLGLRYYYKADLLTVDNAPLDEIALRLKEHPTGVIFTRVPVLP